MSKRKQNNQQERNESTAFSKSEFYGAGRRSRGAQSKKSRKRQQAKYRNNFDQNRSENGINAAKSAYYPPNSVIITPKEPPIVPQSD